MRILKFNESIESEIFQLGGNKLKNSVPVTNNPNLLKIMVDLQMKAYKENKKSLSANLISELTNKFGEANKRMRLEFNTKIWFLQFKNLEFNIFSAKNKGTSIEICNFSYDEIRTGTKQAEIIEFLKELYKVIN